MNHLTFNDDVRPQDFMRIANDDRTIITLIPKETLTAPLFVWDDFEDDKLLSMQNDDVVKLIQTEPNLLPFRQTRLYVRANMSDSMDGTRGFKAWISHEAGILRIRANMQGTHKVEGMWNIDTTLRESDPKGVHLEYALRVGDKYGSDKDFPPHLKNTLRDQAQAIFTSVCWFIREVSSGVNFIASVHPDKQGKSVEWIKARTHYVLIHKAHPANQKEIQAGAKVKEDEKSIKRQAHSRRAHVRILRSPRFKNKVGQTIRVKACWVGPDEWKQFGSIYRMAKNIPENK